MRQTSNQAPARYGSFLLPLPGSRLFSPLPCLPSSRSLPIVARSPSLGQDEQPMPGCPVEGHTFRLRFEVTKEQAGCLELWIEIHFHGQLLSVTLNNQSLSTNVTKGLGLAQAGANVLVVHVHPSDNSSACGIYVVGQLSPFSTVHRSMRLAPSAVEATLSLSPPLLSGQMVLIRQWGTNRAGSASSILSE